MYTAALVALVVGVAVGRAWGRLAARAEEQRRVWRIFDVALGTVLSGTLTAVHGAVRGDYGPDRMKEILLDHVRQKSAERRPPPPTNRVA